MSVYPLFSVTGIEIEYMLVDRDSLAIRPIADTVLQTLGHGTLQNEVALGEVAVSNELVLHVLELKTHGPKPLQWPIRKHFQDTILHLNTLLEAQHCRLLPGGAHPFMDPMKDTRRWPHDNHAIYSRYDAIFDCRGHGWSNLQSMHINLPFASDHDFGLLHTAIRLLLPLMPAMAASTPFLDSRYTGFADARLAVYSQNQQKIPSIAGDIVPAFIATPEAYKTTILQPMYADIRPWDPEGILQFEWLNSRGVIPKFDYHALEIRVLDTQECVDADLGLAELIITLLQDFCHDPDALLRHPPETRALRAVFDTAIREGLQGEIRDTALLAHWQVPARPMTLSELWTHLVERVSPRLGQRTQEVAETILRHGNLSDRLQTACTRNPDHTTLLRVYRKLADCLASNTQFLP